jgi:hypothetical protein
MENDTPPLPSSIEEIDALRVQVALLKREAAVKAANELVAAFERAWSALTAKYQAGPSDEINLETREIKRHG